MRKVGMALWIAIAVLLANGAWADNGEKSHPHKNSGQTQTAASKPLGSWNNPVKTWMPGGERAYLQRLNCPDGNTPKFFRVGNFGQGVYGNIVDGYSVSCGDQKYKIFMDMYHSGYIEKEPVPGFTIDPVE